MGRDVASMTDAVGHDHVREGIVEALRQVYDPEIPVNIYELGLVYGIELSEAGDASIEMTLTSPMCPAAQSLPVAVKHEVELVPGVRSTTVKIVWDPPWGIERMSDVAKFQLGLVPADEDMPERR